MDVHMPCPYHTKLMNHAVPKFKDVLERCHFVNKPGGPIILDPMTTHPVWHTFLYIFFPYTLGADSKTRLDDLPPSSFRTLLLNCDGVRLFLDYAGRQYQKSANS